MPDGGGHNMTDYAGRIGQSQPSEVEFSPPFLWLSLLHAQHAGRKQLRAFYTALTTFQSKIAVAGEPYQKKKRGQFQASSYSL